MKRATAVIYLDQHIKSLPEIIKNKACKNVVNVKGTADIFRSTCKRYNKQQKQLQECAKLESQ